MSVLFGNVINEASTQKLYYMDTNFPYTRLYVYDMDNRSTYELELSERINKPTNGFLYVNFSKSQFDINEIEDSTFIVAIIINNKILHYNSSNSLFWTNLEKATISLNIVTDTDIAENFTVTMNTLSNYTVNDNNEYGTISTSGTSISFEYANNQLDFNKSIYTINADGEDTNLIGKSVIDDYETNNYIICSNYPHRMFISIIYDGKIVIVSDSDIEFLVISNFNEYSSQYIADYYSGTIYRAVEITSDNKISVKNS